MGQSDETVPVRFDRRDIEEIAGAAARKTLHDFMALLGVDIEDQKALNALRADLIFARNGRHAAEEAASRRRAWPAKFIGGAIIATAGAAATALGSWAMQHFR